MTSTNPDPRTTARGQAPASDTPSPAYPEDQTAVSSTEQTPVAAQTPPATTQPPVQRTRAASFWVSVVVTALVLIALIIFLAQNSRQVAVHFLGWSGHISEAVALLIAAVCGALLVAVPASIRIVQLRHGLRKTTRQR